MHSVSISTYWNNFILFVERLLQCCLKMLFFWICTELLWVFLKSLLDQSDIEVRRICIRNNFIVSLVVFPARISLSLPGLFVAIHKMCNVWDVTYFMNSALIWIKLCFTIRSTRRKIKRDWFATHAPRIQFSSDMRGFRCENVWKIKLKFPKYPTRV